jgi:hypothetical protein
MIIQSLIQEIHDLCVHLDGEGLSQEEWENYQQLEEDQLEDLRNKLKGRLIEDFSN